MAKYRKKPVIVEAFQMTKEGRWDNSEWPEWLLLAWQKEHYEEGAVFPTVIRSGGSSDEVTIYTLEGLIQANMDDWILQGVKDELYPCKPDIFEAAFELVEE